MFQTQEQREHTHTDKCVTVSERLDQFSWTAESDNLCIRATKIEIDIPLETLPQPFISKCNWNCKFYSGSTLKKSHQSYWPLHSSSSIAVYGYHRSQRDPSFSTLITSASVVQEKNKKFMQVTDSLSESG